MLNIEIELEAISVHRFSELSLLRTFSILYNKLVTHLKIRYRERLLYVKSTVKIVRKSEF